MDDAHRYAYEKREYRRQYAQFGSDGETRGDDIPNGAAYELERWAHVQNELLLGNFVAVLHHGLSVLQHGYILYINYLGHVINVLLPERIVEMIFCIQSVNRALW
jgi:hypothetical protein